MRVTLINSNRGFGGGEKLQLDIAWALRTHGHEVFFISCSDTVLKRAEDVGLRTMKTPFFNDVDLYSLAKIVSALLRERPDVVIMNDTRDCRVGGLAARIAGVKVRAVAWVLAEALVPE